MKTLLSKAKQKAEEILFAIPTKFAYHNIFHTQLVVKAVGEIAMESNLSTEMLENALVAAWFHDTGYLNGGGDGHEDRSKQIAQSFLALNDVDEMRQAMILDAIDATKMPQQPQNTIEKIICDADLYSLSMADMISNSEKLRDEWRITKGKIFTDAEWLKNNLTFLENHNYFTNYGRTVLAQGKLLNIQTLKARLNFT